MNKEVKVMRKQEKRYIDHAATDNELWVYMCVSVCVCVCACVGGGREGG